MELNFLGRGAMLNPSEGNTSAYFEDEDNFFLLDCGESVASKLISDGLLTDDKEYYVFITHTHSDHIGSLGTLQQYLYWVCGKKLNVVYSRYLKKHYALLKSALDVFGLEPDTYNLIDDEALDNKFETFSRFRYLDTNHGNVPIAAASLFFDTKDGSVLFTGDICNSDIIKEFMFCTRDVASKQIDRMYVDTSFKKNPVHLDLAALQDTIPEDLKDKVYCMHINSKDAIPFIKKAGFKVVEVENKEQVKKLEKTI